MLYIFQNIFYYNTKKIYIDKQKKRIENIFVSLLLPPPHWNDTVNRNRYAVLSSLKQQILESSNSKNIIDINFLLKLSNSIIDNKIKTIEDLLEYITNIQEVLNKKNILDINTIEFTKIIDNKDICCIPKSQNEIRKKLNIIKPLEYNDFTFGKVLGSGSFANVIEANCIFPNIQPSKWPKYAIKVIHQPSIVNSIQAICGVLCEDWALQVFKYEHIACSVGKCIINNELQLHILEYSSKGDQRTCINIKKIISLQDTCLIAIQILLVLKYLNIKIHCTYNDLKPENILIYETNHIKITDFATILPINPLEYSTIVLDDKKLYTLYEIQNFLNTTIMDSSFPLYACLPSTKPQGTIEYIAPEVLLGGTRFCSPASDLWSLGCVLHEILLGYCPKPQIIDNDNDNTSIKFLNDKEYNNRYTNDSSMSLNEWIKEIEVVIKKKQLIGNIIGLKEISIDGADFISSLLQLEPQKRLGIIPVSYDNDTIKIIKFYLPNIYNIYEELNNKIQYTIDYTILFQHPFLQKLRDNKNFTILNKTFDNISCIKIPEFINDTVNTRVIDPAWTRRKNSIMWVPLPKPFTITNTPSIELLPSNGEIDTNYDPIYDRFTDDNDTPPDVFDSLPKVFLSQPLNR